MGLFSFLGDIFGGGGGGSSTTVTTVQEAAQAANITVNPSTSVSLTISTDELAAALSQFGLSLESYFSSEGAFQKSSLDLDEKTFALGLVALQMQAEGAEQSNVLEAAQINLNAAWQSIATNFYTLLKWSALGVGVYLITKMR